MKQISRLTLLALLLLYALTVFYGCGQKADRASHTKKRELTVFAAASLTDAFRELCQSFENEYENVDVLLQLAGSQQLLMQIQHGAQADIFASADTIKMQKAVSRELVDTETVRTFATNTLTLVVRTDRKVTIRQWSDLHKNGVNLVIGNEQVPVGIYTRQALKSLESSGSVGPGYFENVLANVVSLEPTVKSVLAKVTYGEADAGIVYSTDAVNLIKEDISVIPLEPAFQPKIEYPIAMLADARNKTDSRHFLAFIQSPEGQEILQRAGFQTPTDTLP